VIVYVVRHGIAEDHGPDGTDASRRLTPRGRTRMQEIGRGLVRCGVRADAVLTSPLPRASESAAIVAAALDAATPRPLPVLATGTSAAEVLRALAPFARQEHVMVVGHEPTLSELVALVCTGSPRGVAIRLKKGGCVAVELASLNPPRSAVLRWAATPRQLRLAGR